MTFKPSFSIGFKANGKKNKKRPRKRKPLKADPKRQAHASIKGYRYQIWCSVEAWLELAEDETLYLEGAEDFEIVSDGALYQVMLEYRFDSDSVRHTPYILL